jgi:ribosomal-protein-alanine N-acetyltransferase
MALLPKPNPDLSMDDDPVKALEARKNTTPWPEPLLTLSHNLVLRPMHPTDVSEFSRIANNKNISVNMTNRFPSPYTEADAASFITKSLSSKTTNVYAWAISIGPNGPPIGCCGAEPGQDIFCRNAELGYWIAEEHWGKGYGSAICRAFTDWAFEQEHGLTGEKLNRLGANVFGGNPGSGAVLRKCGYEFQGAMKDMVWKRGVVRDLEVYGMTRKEWESKKEG